MKRISRRQLLGGVLFGALGLGGLYAYENRYRDLVVSIVRDRLSYLDLSQVDLDAFADDFIADRGAYGIRGRLFAWAYPVIENAGFLNPMPERTDTFEYRVVSRFLLSTDFFWHGSDETRAIQYVAYDNPYVRLCANPFAQFD